jgi:hypothetical protein
MSSFKKIEINPALFNVGGKTKKNREKKEKPLNTHIISPNILKNTLLKRIKEHKKKELKDLEFENKSKSSTIPKLVDNNTSFSDEFNESIEYLNLLSSEKKKEKINENKKRDLQSKTLKHSNLFSSNSTSNTHPINPYVNIELPEELQYPLVNVTTEQIIQTKNNDDVPYGILKGGKKPTYRDWSKTLKNNVVTNPSSALTISNNNIIHHNSERENKLAKIRAKIKETTRPSFAPVQSKPILESTPFQNSGEKIVNTPEISTNFKIDNNVNFDDSFINTEKSNASNVVLEDTNSDLIINSNIIEQPKQEVKFKRIHKKTICKKYTLGKLKTHGVVSVLLKDRQTRKKVLEAQKKLKKENINEVKNYLKIHNLIKIGSNAPNDVIRKIYESAMLAGEITNNNKEMMLHNFMKDESDL